VLANSSGSEQVLCHTQNLEEIEEVEEIEEEEEKEDEEEKEEDLGTVSELSVDEDMAKEGTGLGRWLKRGRETLTRLFNRTRDRPAKRGLYYRKGLEKPSVRTQQHHSKLKKDREQAVSREYGRPSPLLKFFKAQPPTPSASRACLASHPGTDAEVIELAADQTSTGEASFDREVSQPAMSEQVRDESPQSQLSGSFANLLSSIEDQARAWEDDIEHWTRDDVEQAASELWQREWADEWREEEEVDSSRNLDTHGTWSPDVFLANADHARRHFHNLYVNHFEHAPEPDSAAQDLPGTTRPTPAPDRTTTANPTPPLPNRRRVHVPPPTASQATAVLNKITDLLRPHRDKGYGHKNIKITDHVLAGRLKLMQTALFFYRQSEFKRWTECSELAAATIGKGPWIARRVREWIMAMIKDESQMPVHRYGLFNSSVLDDEDIEQEIFDFLATKGEFFAAHDIVTFLSTPEMMERLGLRKPINEKTAERWLKRHDYRWRKTPTGQYADGHEREDVVEYRNKVFLPALLELEPRLRKWAKDGTEIPSSADDRVVIWWHDESIFYAHDRRKLRWVRNTETAKPYAKGEGVSLMVADFVSADYGFLRSLDGMTSAREIFRPGKNRDGYFVGDDVLAQATAAMDILEQDYPLEKHVLVYDNAPSHIARPTDALSALNMPMGPSANFFCKIKDSEGTVTSRIRMRNARFANGTAQELYYPATHPTHPGFFKGSRVLIQERRARGAALPDPLKLKAACKGFKCPPGATECCCRRVMYTQPDFTNVPSVLEEHCTKRGVRVIFLPRYHCELNFIEQVWGYAKRLYRMYPASSDIDNLEHNTVESLDSVPLDCMRR
jgi:hypothetical protein